MGPRWTPDMAQQDAVRRKQFDPHYSDRLGMVARLDLRARLPSLQVPVALFASDSDRIVPALACAHEMDTLLPDSSVRILPNAGHLALPLADLDWPEWLGELHLRAAAEASA